MLGVVGFLIVLVATTIIRLWHVLGHITILLIPPLIHTRIIILLLLRRLLLLNHLRRLYLLNVFLRVLLFCFQTPILL